MLIDPITQDDWVVNGWKIYCSLHDKLQIQIDHKSVAKNWYKDEAVRNEWVDRLSRCLVSIRRYYTESGSLPQAGDRL